MGQTLRNHRSSLRLRRSWSLAGIRGLFVAGAVSIMVPLSQVPASAHAPDATNAPTDCTKFQADGPHEFSITLDEWTDTARERTVPVRIFSPQGTKKYPVVLFSHGLGGSRQGADYLASRLASFGMLVVLVQHAGSDRSIWEGKPRADILKALARAATDPQVAIQRFMDVPFVLDEIERRAAGGELNADSANAAIAGHSFGAHSVLAALGRTYSSPGGEISFKDPRLKAGVALSPPEPPRRLKGDALERIYRLIDVPILHMTGTRDNNPMRPEQSPEGRLIPFQTMGHTDDFLVVFEGADHNVFAGTPRRINGTPAPESYRPVQADVAAASAAFLSLHLKNDPDARNLIGDRTCRLGLTQDAEFLTHGDHDGG